MNRILPGGLACQWTEDYEFIKCIGEGQVGQVYRAVDIAGRASLGRSSTDVVIKMYKGTKGKTKFKREVDFMRRVQGHPNVVTLLASHCELTKGIVMPFYGELDLHTHVWNCDGLPEVQAKGITRDMLSALHHIHGCGIFHRDIKPENMVIGQDGRVVLVDFDVACDSSDVLACASLNGSLGYCAPEVLLGEPCTDLSDVFSVGCVVYFMFAKVHPFVQKKGLTADNIKDANLECDVKFGKRFANVSRGCLKFILSTVVRCPQRRLSEKRASTHPWLDEEDRQESAEDLRVVPLVNEESEHTNSEGSLLHTKPSKVLSDSVHSLPMANSTRSEARAQSRVAKLKLAGQDVFNKMSRVIGNMRGKSTTVSRLGNRYDDCQEDLTAMAGILIRE